MRQDIYPRLQQQPAVDPLAWSFSIGGLVRHPLILSYSDLQAFPIHHVECAVPCAGSPFDVSQIEQGRWRGVAVSTLFDELHPASNATHAVIHNANGYSTSLSLDWLLRGTLALLQDDALLSPQQGYPVRLIVPGLYGYKMPRWLSRIELTDTRSGFWESRGWNDDGIAPTIAAISRPANRTTLQGDVLLEGFAYSALSPITSIEVSIDDADWMTVDFTPAPPAQLVRWHTVWQPPAPGEYSFRVRATDANGTPQSASAANRSVFPAKPSDLDLHSIAVHITE